MYTSYMSHMSPLMIW